MSEMDYNTRANLIGALANQMSTSQSDDLRIDTSNFITDTGAMDCTAMGLSLDALNKTKNVIELHENKFATNPTEMSAQYLLHLRVAKKCVEEVIQQKQATKVTRSKI